MSDPFAQRPSEDIEASTAITTVSQENLDHAAELAAKQVKAALSGKSQKAGRKAKSRAVEAPGQEPVDSVPDLSISEFDSPEMPEEARTPASEAALTEGPSIVEVTAETEAASAEASAIEPFFVEGDADPLDHQSGLTPFAAETLTETPPVADTSESLRDTIPTAAEESAEALAAFSEQAMASSEAGQLAISDVVQKATDIVEIIAEEVQTMPVLREAEPSLDLPRAADLFGELRIKVVRSVQTNMESSVAFWTALLQAKSPAEVIELNSAHLRQQMETFVSQSLELSQLARRAAALSVTSLGTSHE